MQQYELIETPENVELQQPLAGIGSRFAAGFIDHMIMVISLIVIFLILLLLSPLHGWDMDWIGLGEAEWWVLAILIIAVFLVHWGYFTIFELWLDGQTPGKRNQGLRVVRSGGGAAGFTEIGIRNLLRPVDFLPFGYGVAGAAMFVTPRVQRLGDLAAGTVVARARPDENAVEHTGTTGGGVVTPAALETTGLDPDEYRLIHEYLDRQEGLTPEARQRVLPRILDPILRKRGEELPDRSLETMERYVAALVRDARTAERRAQRQRREEGDET